MAMETRAIADAHVAMPSIATWPVALEDDPEMLSAALALIDEWEPAEDASTTSEDTDARDYDELPETVSSVTDAVPVSLPAPIETRPGVGTVCDPDLAEVCKRAGPLKGTTSRRREEILYLRDKVKALERALASVKRRALGRSAGATGDAEDAAVQQATQMWMEIASRQKEQRQASELVNAKLRMSLSSQLRVAKDLMRLLQRSRRLAPTTPTVAPPTVADECSSALISRRAEVTDEEQLCRLEQQLDAAFHSPNFQSGNDAFRDIRVEDCGDGQVVIVVETSTALPFDAERVRDAVWQSVAMKIKRSHRGDTYESFDASCELFTATLRATVHIGPTASQFEGKLVAKRTVNEAGLPIILQRVSGSATIGDPLDGMAVDEDGWIRLLPRDRLTLFQCSRRMRLASGHERSIGALTEHVLSKVDEELEFKQQLIENLLLSTSNNRGHHPQ
ncbi:hypothetical protein PINS_up012550 [Pythium insidiosum]|nr:hypothetical protein PINS_up012550 [Pythium insidiosum]